MVFTTILETLITGAELRFAQKASGFANRHLLFIKVVKGVLEAKSRSNLAQKLVDNTKSTQPKISNII